MPTLIRARFGGVSTPPNIVFSKNGSSFIAGQDSQQSCPQLHHPKSGLVGSVLYPQSWISTQPANTDNRIHEHFCALNVIMRCSGH